MSKPVRLGFIGLGLMGQAFTKRMRTCGYEVIGYDIAPGKIEQAAVHGVEAAASPGEVARKSDVIHSCVMTAANLEAALFGPDGLSSGMREGQLLIDHTTLLPDVARDFATRLMHETNVPWVDAPISGGPPLAEAGQLAIMVGGDAANVTRASEILNDLGKCTHMGPLGAGLVTKMVNQVIVLNNYSILAEAMTLAEAGGVDASKIPEALGSGYAGSRMLERMYPRMVERDYAPAGAAAIALKDLGMIASLAKSLNVPTPMSGQSENLYRQLCARGHADLDTISVLKVINPKEEL